MTYDVTVIGSGPGGYIAAIRCAQLGLKTALVERYPGLGGTCLHVGCIPSKALLDSSEHVHHLRAHGREHGIHAEQVSVDFAQMVRRKAQVVSTTADGIAFLMKKNRIDVHHGHGSFAGPRTIRVASEGGKSTTIDTRHTIIATGSKPSSLPGVVIDKQRIITSTEALSLPEIPKTLIVIGAGIIGLELGSVFARLGTKVTVVEFLEAPIATMDRALGKELQKVLTKDLGIEFCFQHRVQAVQTDGRQVTITATDAPGKASAFVGDYCLVAVGRRPYTEGLGLESAGVAVDDKGRIPVNAHLETAATGVYAIGDVVRGPMLAHKAEEEGVFVAETIAGQKPHINYLLVPSVVYTWPEVAGVGATEEELKRHGVAYKTGTFPMMALGRARASGDTSGFVKVLADKTSDEILGVHMIGARAADLIGEAAMAMEFRAAAEDVARSCHAHPTFSEAFKEACLAATANRALNV